MYKEAAARWPISALFGKTIGNDYFGIGRNKEMIDEDGFTKYSRSYWHDVLDVVPMPNVIQFAIGASSRLV